MNLKGTFLLIDFINQSLSLAYVILKLIHLLLCKLFIDMILLEMSKNNISTFVKGIY